MELEHYMHRGICALGLLPVTRLFVQPLVQPYINENTKARVTGSGQSSPIKKGQ